MLGKSPQAYSESRQQREKKPKQSGRLDQVVDFRIEKKTNCRILGRKRKGGRSIVYNDDINNEIMIYGIELVD